MQWERGTTRKLDRDAITRYEIQFDVHDDYLEWCVALKGVTEHLAHACASRLGQTKAKIKYVVVRDPVSVVFIQSFQCSNY